MTIENLTDVAVARAERKIFGQHAWLAFVVWAGLAIDIEPLYDLQPAPTTIALSLLGIYLLLYLIAFSFLFVFLFWIFLT